MQRITCSSSLKETITICEAHMQRIRPLSLVQPWRWEWLILTLLAWIQSPPLWKASAWTSVWTHTLLCLQWHQIFFNRMKHELDVESSQPGTTSAALDWMLMFISSLISTADCTESGWNGSISELHQQENTVNISTHSDFMLDINLLVTPKQITFRLQNLWQVETMWDWNQKVKSQQQISERTQKSANVVESHATHSRRAKLLHCWQNNFVLTF